MPNELSIVNHSVIYGFLQGVLAFQEKKYEYTVPVISFAISFPKDDWKSTGSFAPIPGASMLNSVFWA